MPPLGRGRFLVFEGLDGAGTTTQLSRLARHLRNAGFAVQETKEPSTGPVGAVIRQAVEHRIVLDPIAMALAFAADRADHLFHPEVGIAATLKRGEWVLSDRYVLSSLAYQAAMGLDMDWLLALNTFAIDPDITIYVDTPPTECMRRIDSRSSHRELFDKQDALEAVRAQYLKAVARGKCVGRLVTLDGSKTEDDVFKELHRELALSLGGDFVKPEVELK